MPLLVSPATYVTADDFLSMPLDYDLSEYTEDQITDILVRASGSANAIMRRSMLAQEKTKRLYGDGSNRLFVSERPLLYIRKMQFFQPGGSGFYIPMQNILIDPVAGELVQYAPLEFVGLGYLSHFPDGVAIDVTLGYGFGFNPFASPSWTAVDVPAGPIALSPGTYAIGVTMKTFYGETLPTVQTVTTVTGAISISVTPQIGAYIYRVFISQPNVLVDDSGAVLVDDAGAALVDDQGSNPSNLMLAAEIPATTYGTNPAQCTLSSFAAPAGTYPEAAPTSDTSAPVLPQEVREAVRLLAMQVIYEQNNLANRGVAKTESGRKSVQWRSTEGSSGRGVPLYYDQATELLRPYSFQEIY